MSSRVFKLSLSVVASLGLAACVSNNEVEVSASVPSLPGFCEESVRSTVHSKNGEKVTKRWEERAVSWGKRAASYEEIMDVFPYVEEEDIFRTDKGSWTYEFRSAACDHERNAIELAGKGDKEGSIVALRKANAFYDVARFPALVTKEREDIYARMDELYVYFNAVSGNPKVKIETFDYKGHSIEGFFQKPEGLVNPGIIIMTGGLDTWKPSYEKYLKNMWDAGFATFIFDMPGTGSTPVMLDSDGDKMYIAAIDYFKNYEGINGDYIGVYTLSFSGSIGLELALQETGAKAVVDNGGGAHFIYSKMPPAIALPEYGQPEMTLFQQAILWTLGFRKDMVKYPEEALDVWLNKLPELSLVNQGLLPVKSEKDIRSPLLHVHGGKDDLIPMEDYDIVGEMGFVREELLYPEDLHCAPLNFDDHISKTVDFYIRHLNYTPVYKS